MDLKKGSVGKGEKRGTYILGKRIQQLKIPNRTKGFITTKHSTDRPPLWKRSYTLAAGNRPSNLGDEAGFRSADRLFVSAHSKGCLKPRQPHPLKVLRFIVRFAFGRNNPLFHLFIKGQHLMNK